MDKRSRIEQGKYSRPRSRTGKGVQSKAEEIQLPSVHFMRRTENPRYVTLPLSSRKAPLIFLASSLHLRPKPPDSLCLVTKLFHRNDHLSNSNRSFLPTRQSTFSHWHLLIASDHPPLSLLHLTVLRSAIHHPVPWINSPSWWLVSPPRRYNNKQHHPANSLGSFADVPESSIRSTVHSKSPTSITKKFSSFDIPVTQIHEHEHQQETRPSEAMGGGEDGRGGQDECLG